jgi:hypothetical protein
MKASKELVDWLTKQTYDHEGFPRTNEELLGISVGTLRTLIAIVTFKEKEFNREPDGKSITS